MRTRTANALVTATLIALLCAGCGTDDNPTPPAPTLPADYHGVPVTGNADTISPPPPPSPELGPQIIGSAAQYVPQQMADDLEYQVGKVITVTPDCGARLTNPTQSSSFTCNAHWPGGPVGVPFAVVISVDSDGTYSVQVIELKGVLLADQVRANWLQSYSDISYEGPQYANTVSCDRSIPAAVLVPFNKPTPYRCAVAGEVYYAEITSATNGEYPDASVTFSSSETPSASASAP